VEVYRALPGSGTANVAALPMASYEQPRYRVHLGLVPPRGERASAWVVLGLTKPQRG
jgi:hypothetical protein